MVNKASDLLGGSGAVTATPIAGMYVARPLSALASLNTLTNYNLSVATLVPFRNETSINGVRFRSSGSGHGAYHFGLYELDPSTLKLGKEVLKVTTPAKTYSGLATYEFPATLIKPGYYWQTTHQDVMSGNLTTGGNSGAGLKVNRPSSATWVNDPNGPGEFDVTGNNQPSAIMKRPYSVIEIGQALSGQYNTFRSMFMRPDGLALYMGCYKATNSRTVVICIPLTVKDDLRTLNFGAITELDVHDYVSFGVYNLSFSPDGSKMIIGGNSSGAQIHRYDMAPGSEWVHTSASWDQSVEPAGGFTMRGMWFSPDGLRLQFGNLSTGWYSFTLGADRDLSTLSTSLYNTMPNFGTTSVLGLYWNAMGTKGICFNGDANNIALFEPAAGSEFNFSGVVKQAIAEGRDMVGDSMTHDMGCVSGDERTLWQGGTTAKVIQFPLNGPLDLGWEIGEGTLCDYAWNDVPQVGWRIGS